MPTLKQRVRELKSQMQRMLEREKRSESVALEPWWKRHSGAFENDPLFDDAMRLASEYRRAQPRPAYCPEKFTD